MKATELVLRATHASASGTEPDMIDESSVTAVMNCLTKDPKRVREAVAALKVRLKTGHGKTRLFALQLVDRCMHGCGSAFHAAVANNLLSRLVKIALEPRVADPTAAQLQMECVRAIRYWGINLLPRIGAFSNAAKKVAFKEENAASMKAFVEGESQRNKGTLSSVGSLSSFGSTGSATSIGTFTTQSSSASSAGAGAMAVRAAETVFDDLDEPEYDDGGYSSPYAGGVTSSHGDSGLPFSAAPAGMATQPQPHMTPPHRPQPMPAGPSFASQAIPIGAAHRVPHGMHDHAMSMSMAGMHIAGSAPTSFGSQMRDGYGEEALLSSSLNQDASFHTSPESQRSQSSVSSPAQGRQASQPSSNRQRPGASSTKGTWT